MKKLLVLTSFIVSIAINGADYDLTKGYDFTGASSVTPSQLNNLVDHAVIISGKGSIICQQAYPDLVANPRYTNWLWYDINSYPPVIRQWIGGTATNNYAIAGNWQSINVSVVNPGAVKQGAFASGAIQSGDITNNAINNTHIQIGAVQSNSIALWAVGTNHIAPGSVGGTSAQGYNLATQSVTSVNIAAGTIQSTNIASGAISNVNMASGSIASNNIVSGTINTNQFDTNICSSLPVAWAFVKGAGGGAGENLVLRGKFLHVTKYATGQYMVTFTNMTMPDTNYCVIATSIAKDARANATVVTVNSNYTATFNINSYVQGVGYEDENGLSIVVFH